MAIGKASDMVIYADQFWGGFVEELMQMSDAFNAASGGCIQLTSAGHRGEYSQESFIPEIASLITRRDLTAVTAATDLAVAQSEFVRVKLARKIGPVAQTRDAWRKIEEDPSVLSFILGGQIAKAVQVEMLNSTISALAAALSTADTGALENDVGANNITTLFLIDTLALAGDSASDIDCWVMHSKQFFDLLKDQVTNAVYRADGVSVMEGVPATLNRPVIVTDSADLTISGTTTDYYHLGLRRGAATANVSEVEDVEFQVVTGLENLVDRLQGEYAYTMGLKGFQWDIANGAANPDATALGTGTNWDKISTDNRSLAGVIGRST
jgi:hypothetical protein